MVNPLISVIVVYGSVQDKIGDFILSVLAQSYKNVEIICINANCEDASGEILSDLSIENECIKLINLPQNKDSVAAQNAGLNVASGDYVCVFTEFEPIKPDFIAEKFKFENSNVTLQPARIYSRDYIENSDKIEEVIQNKIDSEMKKVTGLFEEFYRNNENLVSNKVYDVTSRCNALEKFIASKQEQTQNEFKSDLNHACDEVYSYINSQINQKGSEIGRVYDEITNNYKYTEKLVDEAKNDNAAALREVYKKLEEVLKDSEIRYFNLQKLIEVTKEEMQDKIEAVKLSGGVDTEKIANILYLERNMNENFDRIYSFINQNNSKFYDELLTLYKQLNKE